MIFCESQVSGKKNFLNKKQGEKKVIQLKQVQVFENDLQFEVLFKKKPKKTKKTSAIEGVNRGPAGGSLLWAPVQPRRPSSALP